MSVQPVTTSKKMIQNTIFNIFTMALSSIISFVMITFFMDKLGAEKYGVWIIIGSIFAYRQMISMGLNSSVNRHIPVELARTNFENIKKVICTSIYYYSFLSLLIAVVTVVFYFNFNDWFSISSEYLDHSKSAIAISGICFCLAMPLQVCSAVLSGLQKFGVMNVIIVSTLITRTLILVFFLNYEYGLLVMAFSFGLNELLSRIFELLYLMKTFPHISISSKYFDFKLLKEMMVYGMNTLLYTIGAVIIYKISDVLIGIFLNTSLVAKFYVATAATMFLAQLLQVFTRVIKPAVSDLDARGEHKKLHEVAILSQKYILILLVPSMFFFLLFAEQFLATWLGDDFTRIEMKEMATVLLILIIGHGIRLSQHGNFLVLVGIGEHKIFGVVTMVTAILCIIFSLISLTILNGGLIALAWSIAIPMVLGSGIFLPIYFCKKMSIKMLDLFNGSIKPALLASIPAVFLLVMIKQYIDISSWPTILGVVITCFIVECFGAWYLCLSSVEKARFSKILKK